MSKYKVYVMGSSWVVENVNRGNRHIFDSKRSAEVFLDVMQTAEESTPLRAEFLRNNVAFGYIDVCEMDWETIESWVNTGTTLACDGLRYDKNNIQELRGVWVNEIRKKLKRSC